MLVDSDLNSLVSMRIKSRLLLSLTLAYSWLTRRLLHKTMDYAAYRANDRAYIWILRYCLHVELKPFNTPAWVKLAVQSTAKRSLWLTIAGNVDTYQLVTVPRTHCRTIVELRAFNQTVQRSTLIVAGARVRSQNPQAARQAVIKYQNLRIHGVDVACHKR